MVTECVAFTAVTMGGTQGTWDWGMLGFPSPLATPRATLGGGGHTTVSHSLLPLSPGHPYHPATAVTWPLSPGVGPPTARPQSPCAPRTPPPGSLCPPAGGATLMPAEPEVPGVATEPLHSVVPLKKTGDEWGAQAPQANNVEKDSGFSGKGCILSLSPGLGVPVPGLGVPGAGSGCGGGSPPPWQTPARST